MTEKKLKPTSSSKKKPSNQRYTSELRWMRNAKLKQAKHFKQHPNDSTVVGVVPRF